MQRKAVKETALQIREQDKIIIGELPERYQKEEKISKKKSIMKKNKCKMQGRKITKEKALAI